MYSLYRVTSLRSHNFTNFNIDLVNFYFNCLRKCSCSNHIFVPKHEKVNSKDISVIQDFVTNLENILVLTGAGISTESGLPDYRSEGVGLYDRSRTRPMQYNFFISSCEARKRYWARNFIAWDKFSSAQPNDTHICLAEWEKKGILNYIITQNVDRLHHKAGSQHVVELHGTSYIVKCLNCGFKFSRYLLQKKFKEVNPNFHVMSDEIRPDADVDIDPSVVDTFNLVNCEKCDGILKPDVVFFGETVPKEVVFDVYSKIKQSNGMLVLGSSLEVCLVKTNSFNASCIVSSIFRNYLYVLQCEFMSINFIILNYWISVFSSQSYKYCFCYF